jgi:signal transduction histidine kinase
MLSNNLLKYTIFLFFTLCFVFKGLSQSVSSDSSNQVFTKEEVIERVKKSEDISAEKPIEALATVRPLYDWLLQNRDTTLIFRVLRVMDYGFSVSGEFDEQIKYAIQQMKLAEAKKDTVSMIYASEALSEAYRSLGNREIALRYSLEAQQLAEATNDKISQGIALLNIGDDYRISKDFGISIMYTEKAYKIFQEINEPYYQAFAEMNLGEIALDKNDPDEALKHLEIAYKAMKDASPLEKSYILECLGNAYRQKKRYDLSMNYLQDALSNAQAIEAKPQLVSVYEELSQTAEANGDIAKALSYFKLFKQFNDELKEKSHNVRTSILQYQYDTHKKNKEIELLNKNQLLNLQVIKNQEHEKYWLLGGILLLSLLIVIAILSYIYRSRQNKKLKIQNEEIENQKTQILQQNILLGQKNIELDKLNEEKDYLLGIAAHDLKSPLKQIIGLVTIIQMEEGNLSESQKDCLVRVSNSANRLSELINKILDVDAVKANKQKLDIQRIDLNPILSALAMDFQNMAVKKQITIHKELDSSAFIMGDSHYTMQIFQNLISNAIKFSPQDKNVYLRLKNNGQKVKVEIQDEGPGLTEEDKNKLFGRFQKLSASPTAGEKSTGLGLSIAKKFSEMMGAEIRCESEEGKGANFIVEFLKSTN